MFTEQELWIQRGTERIYSLCYIPDNKALAKTGEDGKLKFPLIIIGHGYEGSYKDNLNCAERYAAEGFASISFDFCGGTDYARSTGCTEDMSIVTEKDDMIAVYRAALELDFTDPGRIVIWGESMGGYVAALAGAELSEKAGQLPWALVLFYPAFCIRDEALRDHGTKENIQPRVRRGIKLGKCFAEDIWDTDPYKVIGAYKGPVLILHGTKDEVVPIAFSERALKVYENPTYRIIEGAGHGFFNETGAYADRLVTDWLKGL